MGGLFLLLNVELYHVGLLYSSRSPTELDAEEILKLEEELPGDVVKIGAL